MLVLLLLLGFLDILFAFSSAVSVSVCFRVSTVVPLTVTPTFFHTFLCVTLFASFAFVLRIDHGQKRDLPVDFAARALDGSPDHVGALFRLALQVLEAPGFGVDCADFAGVAEPRPEVLENEAFQVAVVVPPVLQHPLFLDKAPLRHEPSLPADPLVERPKQLLPAAAAGRLALFGLHAALDGGGLLVPEQLPDQSQVALEAVEKRELPEGQLVRGLVQVDEGPGLDDAVLLQLLDLEREVEALPEEPLEQLEHDFLLAHVHQVARVQVFLQVPLARAVERVGLLVTLTRISSAYMPSRYCLSICENKADSRALSRAAGGS